jgi:SAM-dependent methyltransferase
MKIDNKALHFFADATRLVSSVSNQLTGRGTVAETQVHISAAAEWLLKAQSEGGGGFSRKYSLYSGWDKPYTETTGYIITTMISASRCLEDERFRISAYKAAHWLLEEQLESGAFSDIDLGLEQAFDTGQVLGGLISAFHEFGESCFIDAAVRAGTWLANVQENDGSWQQVSYNRIRHSYYTKVAGALLQLYKVTGDSLFKDAALRNIDWTLTCQKDNGYFDFMYFREGELPFLHTISYTLEGLLDSYIILREERIANAVLGSVRALAEINAKRDMVLFSQYDERWIPPRREKCITGLAQWVIVLFHAYHLTKEELFLNQAIKTMYYLKSKHYLGCDRNLYGSLPGSVPIWGRYQSFSFPNWGVKFFVDALLKYDEYNIPLWKEQEVWVSESFKFADSSVQDNLSNNDRKYIGYIEKNLAHFDKNDDVTVVDIGCGKGKFLYYFREKYPHWKIIGVDPSFSNGDLIVQGSLSALPLPCGYADVLFIIEVTQHVNNLDIAMEEITRVLKNEGYIIIIDRDPFSLIGALKPLLEIAGCWMYHWDSPFREVWRTRNQWKKVLQRGWNVLVSESFDNPLNRIPFSNRYHITSARREG